VVSYTDTFENIRDDFKANGIATDAPGFYDHPAFIEAQLTNPGYMNNYAKFVLSKNYSEEYLDFVAPKIKFVCDVFYQELLNDGRLGACADMSKVLSKILDRLGVWNYSVNGALTTTFPESSGIPKSYYWPIDIDPEMAGHVWVFAPPFTVIDITIGQQPMDPDSRKHIPDFVYSRESSDVEVGIEDIYSSDVQAEMHLEGIPMLPEGIFIRNPQLKSFFETFHRTVFEHHGAELKYIPFAINMSDESLEDMTDLQLNGKYGAEIFEKKIKPVFARE